MHLVVLTAAALLAGPQPVPAGPAPAATAAALPLPGAPESVSVQTKDKLSLSATYWAPKPGKIAPGAILVHQAGSDRSTLDSYGARLSRVGFAVLSIDLRGHGESVTEELDWTKLDGEGHERLWAFATRDLEAAAEYLRGQKDVHSSSFVLVGHRSGATLVTRHAVEDENVRALALLDPPTEEKEMYGFKLQKDIEALGGLPTFLSVSRDARPNAEAIIEAGHSANGLSFIQLSVLKGKDSDVLSDKKEAAEVTKWLKDQAFPKRGSGR